MEGKPLLSFIPNVLSLNIHVLVHVHSMNNCCNHRYDWCESVRMAAARALGRTGNGKFVHDDLCNRLKADDSQVRVKALELIRHLGDYF